MNVSIVAILCCALGAILGFNVGAHIDQGDADSSSVRRRDVVIVHDEIFGHRSGSHRTTTGPTDSSASTNTAPSKVNGNHTPSRHEDPNVAVTETGDHDTRSRVGSQRCDDLYVSFFYDMGWAPSVMVELRM